MQYNPEKNSPVKLNLETIKDGLNPKQLDKIKYECNLLRKSIQELMYIAPHLFNNGVTSANTKIVEPKITIFTPSKKSQEWVEDNYTEYDNYDV